jgi:hypothetical protein
MAGVVREPVPEDLEIFFSLPKHPSTVAGVFCYFLAATGTANPQLEAHLFA